MEIEPAALSPWLDCERDSEKDDRPLWETIGRVELCAFGAYVAASQLSGAVRKRRVPVSSVSNQNGLGPVLVAIPEAAAAAPAEAAPLPAPAAQHHFQDHFADLPCTADEQAKIKTVVKKLADKGYLNPIVALQLMGIKPKISHVHPLRFLSTALSTPALKKMVKDKILKDPMARNGFLNGVNEGMRREDARGNVDPCVAGFARALGVHPDIVMQLAQAGRERGDWTRMVEQLSG